MNYDRTQIRAHQTWSRILFFPPVPLPEIINLGVKDFKDGNVRGALDFLQSWRFHSARLSRAGSVSFSCELFGSEPQRAPVDSEELANSALQLHLDLELDQPELQKNEVRKKSARCDTGKGCCFLK